MTISLQQLTELFVATKLTEGKTEKTVDWYSQKLATFARFLGENPSLPDFTLHNARAFVAHLQGKECKFDDHPYRPTQDEGLSAHTVQGYVRTLKSFSSWLAEESFTPENRLARLKLPKAPEPVIEILTDAEIGQVLGVINSKCILGARLHTIVTLLLDTGMRASELCGLTLDDLHLNEGWLKVMGKGRKERLIPFGNTAKKALLRWTVTWRPALTDGEVSALFVNHDGSPLTYSALSQAVKRLGRRSGVERLHPHLFRHTFAVRYLMNGGDVMTLRLILGHTTLAVTQMYMHLAAAHVQVQHHKFSPMDRLKIER